MSFDLGSSFFLLPFKLDLLRYLTFFSLSLFIFLFRHFNLPLFLYSPFPSSFLISFQSLLPSSFLLFVALSYLRRLLLTFHSAVFTFSSFLFTLRRSSTHNLYSHASCPFIPFLFSSLFSSLFSLLSFIPPPSSIHLPVSLTLFYSLFNQSFPVFLRFIHFSLLTSQSFSLVTYLPFSSLHSNNLLTTSFPSCLLPLTLSILHSTSLVPSFPIQNFTPLPFLSSIIFFLSPHNPFVLPLLFPIQPFNLSFFSLYSLHVFP